MKTTEEVTACVVDAGTFVELAAKLSERMEKVFYYTPWENEYIDAKRCIVGTGLEKVERLDEFLDPDVLPDIDLFVFPDIGYAGLQRHLRSLGKAVWGSMEGTDYELYRTRFLDMLAEVGLPVAPSKTVVGLSALERHLRGEKDKWIKVNRFRGNMETWHHVDAEHSEPILRGLADEFGGVADKIIFVVQDPIPNAQEVGYDGFCVDGQFPSLSYQGYEKKNELYLGSWLKADEMPDAVKTVNKALSPLLEEIGYRNFIATEIRDEFFIDPTMRMAGQTMEHVLETCTNLADVIWHGANGELVDPKFSSKFAAEATLHYTAGDDWKVLRIAPEDKKWFKLYQYCERDGLYHFPPGRNDEVGVVIGNGETVEEAIDDLKAHLELVKDEPVHAELHCFADLVKEIKEAQAKGVHFSDKPLPTPAAVLA